MCTFLKASDNNRSTTVYKLFVAAVGEFGCPSRLRTDKGGENRLICQAMEKVRGADRGSAIQGKSVHNQ